jgi:hypothetical protein
MRIRLTSDAVIFDKSVSYDSLRLRIRDALVNPFTYPFAFIVGLFVILAVFIGAVALFPDWRTLATVGFFVFAGGGLIPFFFSMKQILASYTHVIADWTEFVSSVSRLPQRWVDVWEVAAGSHEKLSASVRAAASKNHPDTMMQIAEEDALYASGIASTFKKDGEAIGRSLKSSTIAYVDYPAAWLLLFHGVPLDTVLEWSTNNLDDALRLYIQGANASVIGGAAGNDIDPDLLDSLLGITQLAY